jgi:hypothetical protein
MMMEYDDQRCFVHRIDPENRICFVNDAWLAFADENGWRLGARQVLGASLMSQIADPETRHIYRLLVDRVRDTARPVSFRYRCDSPDLRRFMAMRISARGDGQVEFRSHVLHLEPRDPIRVLDPAQWQRSGDVLQICSWCKAVLTHTSWLALEEAVQRLGMLSETALPRLSHGVCPACSARMNQVGAAS